MARFRNFAQPQDALIWWVQDSGTSFIKILVLLGGGNKFSFDYRVFLERIYGSMIKERKHEFQPLNMLIM